MKKKLEEAVKKTEKALENDIIKEAKKVWHYQHPNPIEMAIFGAKWQQERSYSEEEVGLLNKMFELYWYKNNNEHEDNLEEWELSKRLFEKFKKK